MEPPLFTLIHPTVRFKSFYFNKNLLALLKTKSPFIVNEKNGGGVTSKRIF
jgi:hypothetical protein